MDAFANEAIELIGMIYDAVLEPHRWSATIDRIRRSLGFHNAILASNALPTGDCIWHISSNIPQSFIDAFSRLGPDLLAVWGGPHQVALMPMEEPLIYSHYRSPELPAGNPFFEEWVKPQELTDEAALVLDQNSTSIATLGLGIHQSMPPISEEQIERLRVLAPHLRRAVIIGGLLESTERSATSLEAALGLLQSAVVLVDRHLGIVYANGRAERMLQAGEPIARRHGRLAAPRELVPGQIASSVAAATQDDHKLQQGAGIPLRRLDGVGAVAHVLPLSCRTQRPAGSAVAAIFVAEPFAELNIPFEALRHLYGLRPAEARVMELLVAGRSTNEIAKALSVAPSTVKTHTLRLFDKLGVHSRAGVVHFAHASSLTIGS